MNVVSNKECASSKGSSGGSVVSYTGLITESMICAKDYYQDSCQGDSGRSCNVLYYDAVFARVFDYSV